MAYMKGPTGLSKLSSTPDRLLRIKVASSNPIGGYFVSESCSQRMKSNLIKSKKKKINIHVHFLFLLISKHLHSMISIDKMVTNCRYTYCTCIYRINSSIFGTFRQKKLITAIEGWILHSMDRCWKLENEMSEQQLDNFALILDKVSYAIGK